MTDEKKEKAKETKKETEITHDERPPSAITAISNPVKTEKKK